MSREWLAVSSFTGTIPRAAQATFCSATSSSRTGNRRCHCYTGQGNGASRFHAIPSLYTFRTPRSLGSRPTAIAFSPFVHAACYFFLLLSEHGSHPNNARRVSFSTTTTVVADAALCRCCCYPAASNSIRLCDLVR